MNKNLMMTAALSLLLCLFGCEEQNQPEQTQSTASGSTSREEVIGEMESIEPAFPFEGRFADPIVIGTDAAYPPMEFVDMRTNQVVGFDVDLIKEVGKRGGFRPQVRNVDWKAIFGALENEEIDAIISSVTITEERKQKYDFSEPYYEAAQRLVVRFDEQREFMDRENLKGARVGAQIGTTGALLMQENFPEVELVTYDSYPLAFQDLQADKLDGVIVDEPVAVEYTRLKEDTADQLQISGFGYSDEYYGVVVRKGDTELLKRINAGIAAVKEAEIDRDLQKKWLE